MLSCRLGSGVLLVTLAGLVSVEPVRVARQTRMIVLVEPSPIEPREQVSVALEAGSGGVHEPWRESARTKLVPAGSGSLTTTSSAAARPDLVAAVTCF